MIAMLDMTKFNQSFLKSLPQKTVKLIELGEQTYDPSTGQMTNAETEIILNGYVSKIDVEKLNASDQLVNENTQIVIVVGNYQNISTIRIDSVDYKTTTERIAQGYTKWTIDPL